MHQPEHSGWEQLAPQHADSSWHLRSSARWQDGNFDYYQQQPYEEVPSGHQGRRMSFSTYGYHDQPMGYHEQQMERPHPTLG